MVFSLWVVNGQTVHLIILILLVRLVSTLERRWNKWLMLDPWLEELSRWLRFLSTLRAHTCWTHELRVEGYWLVLFCHVVLLEFRAKHPVIIFRGAYCQLERIVVRNWLLLGSHLPIWLWRVWFITWMIKLLDLPSSPSLDLQMGWKLLCFLSL